MKTLITQILMSTLLFAGTWAQAQVAPDREPKIQIAILLDGSGSMQGLIDQARRQIWKVVNELGRATKFGINPKLEISVYEYGKDNIPAESGFLRQLIALSTDLDSVSEQLGGIIAKGGDEFTGMAIQAATHELQWSRNSGDYKAIFISGNETMEQGPVKILDAVRDAFGRDIIINTIHAKGTAQHDMQRDLWQSAADAGGGKALEIALNLAYRHIPTPVDDEILSLNNDLNATYLPFGLFGQSEYDKMLRADDSASADGSLWDRGLSKSGGYYNSYTITWDLVAAATAHIQGIEAFLRTVPVRDLPLNMQAMTLAQQVTYIGDKAFTREQVQLGIKDLSEVRQALIDHELNKDQDSALAGLDRAMIAMLQEQLRAKGFQLRP